MATIDDFLPFTLLELPGCDNLTVENYLRSAIIEFCEKSWLIRHSFEVAVTTDNIDTELNNAVDITVGEFASESKPVAITELFVDATRWETDHREMSTAVTNFTSIAYELEQGKEKKYFYFPNTSTVRIYPITKACKLFVEVAFAPIRSFSTIPDVLYEDFLETIASGAKSKLQMIPNKPWTEGSLAAYNKMEFRRGVNKAKLRAGKGYSDTSQTMRGQYFWGED